MNDIPTITYKKWWHRFSPKHRRIIKLMNDMMIYDWHHGLQEELQKNLNRHMNEFYRTGRTKIGDKTFYWN